MKYARICIDVLKSFVQIEFYNDDGLQLESRSFSNVKILEVYGVVRLDLDSVKLSKDVLCIFSEGIDKITFTEGALKIG
jgi:hypothetical protein